MAEKGSKRLNGRSTKVYMESVMQKVFRKNITEHLDKLLKGDRATLDLCAQYLEKNLTFFELAHTLCLVTNQRFDLEHKDEPAKAADEWLCWYEEKKDHLSWDATAEVWKA